MIIMSENRQFNYSYSAPQQAEINRIRAKYAPTTREEDKMERLRRLDKSASRPGTVLSLIIGIIGTLILGIGMCCVLLWDGLAIPGVVIGLVGIAGVLSAHPVYRKVTEAQRAKLAPEILKLTDELRK